MPLDLVDTGQMRKGNGQELSTVTSPPRAQEAGQQAADTRGPWLLHLICNVVSKVGPTFVLVGGGLWVAFEYMDTRDAIRKEHKATLAAKRVENEQKEQDLNNSKVERLRTTLRIVDVERTTQREVRGLAEYEVRARLEIVNDSQMPINIAVTVFDCYIGSLPEEWPPDGHEMSIIPLGTASGRWDLKGTSGALKRKRLYSFGGVNDGVDIDELPSPCNSDLDGIVFATNSVGCSDLKPGGSTVFSETFLVKAPPGSYLDLVVSGCDDSCNRWRTSRSRRLPL